MVLLVLGGVGLLWGWGAECRCPETVDRECGKGLSGVSASYIVASVLYNGMIDE